MTTTASLNTKGLNDILEDLARLGRDIDAAAGEATHAGGDVVHSEMVDLVPVRSGNLRDHVLLDGPHQDGNFIFCEVGVIHDAKFTDADTARYANAIEYGTATMQAQPYIRPAIDRRKKEALDAMRNTLAEWMTER